MTARIVGVTSGTVTLGVTGASGAGAQSGTVTLLVKGMTGGLQKSVELVDTTVSVLPNDVMEHTATSFNVSGAFLGNFQVETVSLVPCNDCAGDPGTGQPYGTWLAINEPGATAGVANFSTGFEPGYYVMQLYGSYLSPGETLSFSVDLLQLDHNPIEVDTTEPPPPPPPPCGSLVSAVRGGASPRVDPSPPSAPVITGVTPSHVLAGSTGTITISGTNLAGATISILDRSKERRVGKECRSRWSPDH